MDFIDRRFIVVLVGNLVGSYFGADLALLVGGFIGAFHTGWRYRFVGAVMSWLCGSLMLTAFDLSCSILGMIIFGVWINPMEISATFKQCQTQIRGRIALMAIDQLSKCTGFRPKTMVRFWALCFFARPLFVHAGWCCGAMLACHWAWLSLAKQGNATTIAKLLESGVDVNRTDSSTGRTALHMAAESGNVEAVTALLAAGARVDKLDKSNCTALHLAAQSGSLAVVKALVDAGCNVESRASDGSLAFDRAIGNRAAVAEYLMQAQHNRPSPPRASDAALGQPCDPECKPSGLRSRFRRLFS